MGKASRTPSNISTIRERFEYKGEPRTRIVQIEATVIRRRLTVPRDKQLRPVCMRSPTSLRYDPYPEHTEGGHLIGLHIGGEDAEYNLVPMYADFNQVTWLKREQLVYRSKIIDKLRINIGYSLEDPRVPEMFVIQVRKMGAPNLKSWATERMMTAPRPPCYPISRAAVALIQRERAKMGSWKLEDRFPNNINYRAPSDLSERRYALLDYLFLEDPGAYVALCDELQVRAEVPSISGGRPFAASQRELILQLNYIHNNYVLLSDLDRTPLLTGSTTHAPQVDHIVGRQAHFGSNAFSNAQVLSSLQNRQKSG